MRAILSPVHKVPRAVRPATSLLGVSVDSQVRYLRFPFEACVVPIVKSIIAPFVVAPSKAATMGHLATLATW